MFVRSAPPARAGARARPIRARGTLDVGRAVGPLANLLAGAAPRAACRRGRRSPRRPSRPQRRTASAARRRRWRRRRRRRRPRRRARRRSASSGVSSPLRCSVSAPPSPSSLAPPTYSPPTKTAGTDVRPVRAATSRAARVPLGFCRARRPCTRRSARRAAGASDSSSRTWSLRTRRTAPRAGHRAWRASAAWSALAAFVAISGGPRSTSSSVLAVRRTLLVPQRRARARRGAASAHQRSTSSAASLGRSPRSARLARKLLEDPSLPAHLHTRLAALYASCCEIDARERTSLATSNKMTEEPRRQRRHREPHHPPRRALCLPRLDCARQRAACRAGGVPPHAAWRWSKHGLKETTMASRRGANREL